MQHPITIGPKVAHHRLEFCYFIGTGFLYCNAERNNEAPGALSILRRNSNKRYNSRKARCYAGMTDNLIAFGEEEPQRLETRVAQDLRGKC